MLWATDATRGPVYQADLNELPDDGGVGPIEKADAHSHEARGFLIFTKNKAA
jgi:hypothetical protein